MSTVQTIPEISCIVVSFNTRNFTVKAIESLKQQTECSHEIIVVDNNSRDQTETVVSNYAARLHRIRLVAEQKQGLSHARNRGAIEAAGAYLLYLDDDAVAPPDYLLKIYRIITDLQPDICGGPVYPYYTSPKPFWFKDAYEIRRHAEETGFSTTCSISGSNFVIKKELLNRLGMFDTSFGMRGEELGLLEERKVLEPMEPCPTSSRH